MMAMPMQPTYRSSLLQIKIVDSSPLAGISTSDESHIARSRALDVARVVSTDAPLAGTSVYRDVCRRAFHPLAGFLPYSRELPECETSKREEERPPPSGLGVGEKGTAVRVTHKCESYMHQGSPNWWEPGRVRPVPGPTSSARFLKWSGTDPNRTRT
jgi:hypothetical protein